MKRQLFYLIGIILSVFIIQNVHAEGIASITMSCPSSVKPGSNVECTVYANVMESNIIKTYNVKVETNDVVTKQNFSIDNAITLGISKSIGTVSITTVKAGTGTVTVSFDADFADHTTKKGITTSQKIAVTNNPSSTSKIVSTFLKDIKVSSGTLSPAFSKDVYNYVVKLDKTVDKITIQGIREDTDQKVTGEVKDSNIKFGINNYSLIVSNGSNQKRTYNVTIVREDNRDTNALLQALELSMGSLSFSPNVFEYSIKVLYDTTSINVVATPEKATSKVNIEGDKDLKVGDNEIKIKVTAEKGNQNVYKIKATRLAEGETLGDNPNIKNIKIKGYDFVFDYDKEKYKLVIGREKKLDIKVIMEDKHATYTITGNKDLEDGKVIKINTKSLDGEHKKTYKITVTKPSYTLSYVITGIALAAFIMIPTIIYFKDVKAKKQEVDVNGYKDDKAYHDDYVKTTIIGSSDLNQMNTVKQNINPNEKPTTVQNDVTSNIYANNSPNGFSNNKCPNCGRELLGQPIICPYCNTTLRQ